MEVQLVVHEATLDDRRDIWLWWNDPVTRQMMKRPGDVPWEDHCKWFEMIMQNPDMILIVGVLNGERMGNTRFDLRAPHIYEVSINLNPTFRGKGLASQLLIESMKLMNNIRRVEKFYAGFKKNNEPSKKSFLRAGFELKQHPSEGPGLRNHQPDRELYCELAGAGKKLSTVNIQVREAHANDRGVIVEWYNDRGRRIIYPVRKISNKDAIKRWFEEQLQHKQNLLLIGTCDIIRIGAIYFRAAESSVYEAFITLKMNYCMRDMIPHLLEQGIETLRTKRTVKKVFMQIPNRTPASRFLFERAGMKLENVGENMLLWERSFDA